uniref:Uncharacterized protein n=1 Tax=Trypanosoma congolense (strain IL3000) TaxID=1068625 RepID=G0UPW1_TRYCI|nr:hypothetical protein, unlikely [Trypanosoma congolense IL3000]
MLKRVEEVKWRKEGQQKLGYTHIFFFVFSYSFTNTHPVISCKNARRAPGTETFFQVGTLFGAHFALHTYDTCQVIKFSVCSSIFLFSLPLNVLDAFIQTGEKK